MTTPPRVTLRGPLAILLIFFPPTMVHITSSAVQHGFARKLEKMKTEKMRFFQKKNQHITSSLTLKNKKEEKINSNRRVTFPLPSDDDLRTHRSANCGCLGCLRAPVEEIPKTIFVKLPIFHGSPRVFETDAPQKFSRTKTLIFLLKSCLVVFSRFFSWSPPLSLASVSALANNTTASGLAASLLLAKYMCEKP